MKTILLIEDNDDIRKNIVEILQFANYKVLDAENGKAGIQLALANKPDLIVCDVMMPVMDGYSVLNILQKNPETQHIPFIFLTAKTEREEVRKGMTLGADDYITKPFEEVELLDAIERRLKKLAFLKEKFSAGLNDLETLVKSTNGNDVLNNIIAEHTGKTIKKKFSIYTEQNHPINLYYVLSGSVRTFKINDTGKELTTGMYRNGEFFGYTALLEGTSYKESAETLENSEIIIIPKRVFEDMLTNVNVLRKFVHILAGNISDREEHLLNIAYNSVRKKVAITLINLHNGSNDPHKGILIGRETIASMAGIAKETVTRTLTDFSDEKIITVNNSLITIIDLHKLENMVN